MKLCIYNLNSEVTEDIEATLETFETKKFSLAISILKARQKLPETNFRQNSDMLPQPVIM